LRKLVLAGSSSQLPDDFALMQAIARRDRDALAALYDRHSPMLLAICRRVLKDAGEAEDVMTDVFFEVWAKADRFDSSRGNPLTYLVTLSRSRAIDRQRSRSSRPKVTSDFTDAASQTDPVPNPFESIHLKERQTQVRAALSSLDPMQREALECSFYEGLSHSEIAEKLNRPLGTVKTYIRQGLIRLRDSLRITQ
jgi:RNA polymerase sigma-70 factor (ECF subfamily)